MGVPLLFELIGSTNAQLSELISKNCFIIRIIGYQKPGGGGG